MIHIHDSRKSGKTLKSLQFQDKVKNMWIFHQKNLKVANAKLSYPETKFLSGHLISRLRTCDKVTTPSNFVPSYCS